MRRHAPVDVEDHDDENQSLGSTDNSEYSNNFESASDEEQAHAVHAVTYGTYDDEENAAPYYDVDEIADEEVTSVNHTGVITYGEYINSDADVSDSPASDEDNSSYADDSFEVASEDNPEDDEENLAQDNQVTVAAALPATPRRQVAVVPLGIPTRGPRSIANSPAARQRQRAQQQAAALAPSREMAKLRSERALDEAGILSLSYDSIHQTLRDILPVYDDLMQLKLQFTDDKSSADITACLAPRHARVPAPSVSAAAALRANLREIFSRLMDGVPMSEARQASRTALVERCLDTFFVQRAGRDFLASWVVEVTGRQQSLKTLYDSFVFAIRDAIYNTPEPLTPGNRHKVSVFGGSWVSSEPRREQDYCGMKQASIAESVHGDGSVGWKVHIAVDESVPGNVAAAYNAAVRLAHIRGITGLKVLRDGKALTSLRWEEQHGKQITLYFGSTALVQAYQHVIIRYLSELAQQLHDLNIVTVPTSRADCAFPEPFQAFSYRNDQDQYGHYISATLDPADLEELRAADRDVWNPGGHDNPWPALIAQLHPPQQAVPAVVGAAVLRAQPQPPRQDQEQAATIAVDSTVAEAKTNGLGS